MILNLLFKDKLMIKSQRHRFPLGKTEMAVTEKHRTGFYLTGRIKLVILPRVIILERRTDSRGSFIFMCAQIMLCFE